MNFGVCISGLESLSSKLANSSSCQPRLGPSASQLGLAGQLQTILQRVDDLVSKSDVSNSVKKPEPAATKPKPVATPCRGALALPDAAAAASPKVPKSSPASKDAKLAKASPPSSSKPAQASAPSSSSKAVAKASSVSTKKNTANQTSYPSQPAALPAPGNIASAALPTSAFFPDEEPEEKEAPDHGSVNSTTHKKEYMRMEARLQEVLS